MIEYADVYIVVPGGSREICFRHVMVRRSKHLFSLMNVRKWFEQETGRKSIAVIVKVQ
jgi:hypothetical protein